MHRLVLYSCVIAILVTLNNFVVENTVPIDVRILFFRPCSAKSLARCMIITVGNSTNDRKPLFS